MRLFIGIEFPKEIKLEIDKFLAPLRKSSKGWEQPNDYHQTLLFIGEASVEQLADIQIRLEQISFKPFVLETFAFKFFSRRIMYLDFKPSVELIKLHAEVQKLFPEWIRPNDKEFLPHLTVKRWQRYEYDDLANGLKNREFKPIKFTVSSIALFKSEKDLMNNKYHIIYRKEFDAK